MKEFSIFFSIFLIFFKKITFLQNHHYFKITYPNQANQIDAFALIEDSKKLPLKSREFLNTVCRFVAKSSIAPAPQKSLNTPVPDQIITPPIYKLASNPANNNMTMQ